MAEGTADYTLVFVPDDGNGNAYLLSYAVDTINMTMTPTGNVGSSYTGWRASGTSLVLSGFNFSTTASIGLIVMGDTEIILEDGSENSISCTGNQSWLTSAIVCATLGANGGVTIGALTVSGGEAGTGKLSVQGSSFTESNLSLSNDVNSMIASCGIYASQLNVNGGVLDITPGDVSLTDCNMMFLSAGIYVSNGLTVDSGSSVTVNPWSVTINRDGNWGESSNINDYFCTTTCAGLCSYQGSITLNGTVTSAGANAMLNSAKYLFFTNAGIAFGDSSDDYEYNFNGGITATGGSITAADSICTMAYSAGVADPCIFDFRSTHQIALTVSGGTLDATGGNITASMDANTTIPSPNDELSTSIFGSAGVACPVTLSDGSLNATGGAITASNFALSGFFGSAGVYNKSTVNGGTLTATGGNITKTNSSSGGEYRSAGGGGSTTVSAAAGVASATAIFSGGTLTNNDSDNTLTLTSAGQSSVIGEGSFWFTIGNRAYITLKGSTYATNGDNYSIYESHRWRTSADGEFISSSVAPASATYPSGNSYAYYTYIEIQPALIDIATISAPAAIYSGQKLTLTAPDVTYNGYTPVSTTWQYSPSNSALGTWVDFDPAVATFTSTQSNYYIRYLVTFQTGDTTLTACSNAVRITINASTQLTVSGTSVGTIVYSPIDWSTTATFTSINGIAEGDDVQVSIAAASYNTPAVSDNAAATVRYTISGTDAAKYIAPVDQTVYGKITPAPITVTYPASITSLTDPRAMVYNGGASQTVTVPVDFLGGIHELDAAKVTVKATVTFPAKTVGEGKAITVTYSLTGTGAANYSAPAGESRTDGAISKATITVYEINSGKTYDGTTAFKPVITCESSVNLADEDVKVVLPGVFDNANCGTNRTVTLTGSAYLSGDDADNYALSMGVFQGYTQLTGVTISKKQLGVSGTTIGNKVYDGTMDATVTDIGVVTGVVGTDAVTVTAAATFLDKNAAEDKQVRVQYTISGADSGNYLAPNDSIVTATITKRPVTINADGTYGTATDLSGGTVSGVIEGDAVSAEGTITATATGIRTYTSTYGVLNGDDAGNYEITSVTATIGQKYLPVTGTPTALDKIYDGTATATALIGTLQPDMSVLIGNDAVSLGIQGVYTDAAVGNDKTVTLVCILLGEDAVNYYTDASFTTSANITAKALTVTGSAAANKVYDGATATSITVGTVTGIVEGDDVTVSARGAFIDAEAGVGKTVTITYALSGLDAGNYSAPENGSTSANITAKALTVTGSTAANKVYDGATATSITVGTVQGIAEGDDVTVSARGAFADAEIGMGKTVTVTYTLSGSDAGNYSVPENGSTSASILSNTPRIYTMTGGANSRWYIRSSSGLSFTTGGANNDYVNTQIDGVDADPAAVTVASYGADGTSVSLSAALLRSLIGTHTIRIVFLDGYAETKFTVARTIISYNADTVPLPPDTGDAPAILPLLCFAAFTLFITGRARTSRR